MTGSRLIVANCNLLNLQRPGVPIYGRPGWSQEAYDAKVSFLARVVQASGADVIGFQELWDRQALEDVFRTAGLLDAYDLITRSRGTEAGIDVALAARKGMLKGAPVWMEEFPATARFVDLVETRDAQETVSVTIRRFSRPPLKVVIGTGAGKPDITLFVVHLKSKGPTNLRKPRPNSNPVLREHFGIAQSVASHVRRIVEAGALRAELDGLMKDNQQPFIVLGDVNDTTTSVSTELLTGNPGYRFFAASKAGSKTDAGLYTVEKLQQLRSFSNVYYTYIHENKMESLDHILVSDAFYDNAVARQWSFREMRVINDHLTASKTERERFGYTDHGVVVAEFDWNPMARQIRSAARGKTKPDD